MSIIRFIKFPALWLFSQWLTPPRGYHCWNSHFVPCWISGTLAILPMVDPPRGYHCWNSHFVPCWISGTLAILPMVDPPRPPYFSPYIRKRPRHEVTSSWAFYQSRLVSLRKYIRLSGIQCIQCIQFSVSYSTVNGSWINWRSSTYTGAADRCWQHTPTDLLRLL